MSQIGQQLIEPLDVAVSSTGEIYVLDETRSAVSVFNADGKFKFSFGTEGIGPGQFSKPRSIALTEQLVIVADTGNNRIQVFNRTGDLLYAFGAEGASFGHFRSPETVVLDDKGFIYVGDSGNQRVQVFSPNGVPLSIIEFDGRVVDLAIDVQDTLYVLLADPAKLVKCVLPGKITGEFSFAGFDKASLGSSVSLEVDRRGNVYIAEKLTQSVKKFDPGGNLLISFGSMGDGRGQFKQIRGMRVGPDDRIYLADSENGRIQILQFNGNTEPQLTPRNAHKVMLDFYTTIDFEETIVDLFSIPGKGLYALSSSGNRILIAGANGQEPISETGGDPDTLLTPQAIHVTLDGSIFAADTGNSRVVEFNPKGEPVYRFGRAGELPGSFMLPHGIAVDSGGYIYVADTRNDRIQKFNSDGIFLESYGERSETRPNDLFQLKFPTALTVDSKDRLLAVDYANDKIKAISPSGQYLGYIGGPGHEFGKFTKISDIALDENDYLYVADFGNHRVQIFDPSGYFLMAFGAEGKGRGYFEEISAIAVSESKIFVADYRSSKVQVFRYSPTGVQKEDRDDRLYLAKTAFPSDEPDQNSASRFAKAKEEATAEAVSELTRNLNLPREELKKLVRIESVASMNNGEIKVTVSISRDAVNLQRTEVK